MNHFTLFTLFALSVFSSESLSAQKEFTAAQVVEENLSFYNQRNLEGFMSSFSDKITLYAYDNDIPVAKGREAIKTLYSKLFEESPNLHSTILHRAVIGNKVIDHESIVGRKGKNEAVEMVIVYVVENQKIVRMTVIKE